jgi:hypothetical protein
MEMRKSLAYAMVGMFVFFASSAAHAESFDSLLGVDSAIEIDKIEAVDLADRSFATADYATQYSDALGFFSALKGRLASLYADDRISYYRINDIIIDLRSLRDDLDTYFLALQVYEVSGNELYHDVAEYKRVDIRASYQKLAGHLGQSLKSDDEDSDAGYEYSGYDNGSYRSYRYYY